MCLIRFPKVKNTDLKPYQNIPQVKLNRITRNQNISNPHRDKNGFLPMRKQRRGGSNEYPHSMFWSRNKKNRYTFAYPSFAISGV